MLCKYMSNLADAKMTELYQGRVELTIWPLHAQVKVVATAAEETAKAFITLLNPQAVRVVLPDLLAALDTKKNWQTKIAALQALSELCKRAPLQTSVCLPDAIPVVTSIMGDAKPQVKVRLLSFCHPATCVPALVVPCHSIAAFFQLEADVAELPLVCLFGACVSGVLFQLSTGEWEGMCS